MITPGLNRQLANHFKEEGRFSPFTYTIGLESSIEESEDAIQHYPIPEPITDEKLSQFIKSLTFFHETTHLCQFLSTAYGLRTLRYTLICLKNLSRLKGWQLPIVSTLQERIDKLSDEERMAYEGALIFLDGMDQLRLHQYMGVNHESSSESIEVGVLPWSPHFFQLSDQSLESREEFARFLPSIGAHVRKLPYLNFKTAPVGYQIILNVATLMESFAVLVEMNHIANAFRLPMSGIADLLPPGNEYHALSAYFLQNDLCSPEFLITTLSICIDAALMYDPFILYNVPWDAVDENGRHDQYPGETFLVLCEGLKKTEPISKLDENGVGVDKNEVGRFYKELCLNAGLPDPNWMAQKSYEVAYNLWSKSPSDKTLLGRALKAHTDALKFRCDYGAETFPYYLPTTECINKFIDIAIPAVSFYNLHTRQPDHFNPLKIDAITIHSILLQAIVHSTIECPLKMGEPFFCDSAVLPANDLCVWLHEYGTSECLVDVLERYFEFKSSR